MGSQQAAIEEAVQAQLLGHLVVLTCWVLLTPYQLTYMYPDCQKGHQHQSLAGAGQPPTALHKKGPVMSFPGSSIQAGNLTYC